MKPATKRLLAFLLAAVMVVLPMVACGENTENGETGKESSSGTAGESVEETKGPSVEKKDYDAEFTVIYCSDTFRNGYYFIEDEDREQGNDLDDKLYERMINTEEYLGVEIITEDGGDFQEYTTKVDNTITAGDDAYQLVLTHVYQGVSGLITSNRIRPFNDFDSIDLEADYWNSTLMQDLAINDDMYLGYSDFCLSNCYIIAFNKEMVNENANQIGNLYDQVRDKTWTLDKFISYSKLVYKDSNGNSAADEEDTYGFASLAWVPLISFQTAADIPIVARDKDDGHLYVSPMVDNGDKAVDLAEMITEFIADNSTFTWSPLAQWGSTTELHLESGRVMFELLNNFNLVTTKESDVKVGVLPYPKWNEKQAEYKTLSWNGFMVIPTTVKDLAMVGDTIEMLSYFSDPVTTAFYETLLGAKIADAPDDVQMLDIIWKSQVSDYAMALNNVTDALDKVIYAIPHHITAGAPAYSTYVRKNAKAANAALEKMFTEQAEKDD